jgi:hypothetical protein
MKLKKVLGLVLATTLALSMVACGAKKEEVKEEDVKTEETTEPAEDVAEATEPTQDNPIVVDKEAGTVKIYTEVNGTYFTEGTRHGIVFKDGGNGDKSILRAWSDEKEFYQALVDIGAEASDNVKMEDMGAKDPDKDGNAPTGTELELKLAFDDKTDVAFEDAIIQVVTDGSEPRPVEIRFGGNLDGAKDKNTGCITCLDSCAVGITSNAAWKTGSTGDANLVTFNGNDKVLPADGTPVIVTYSIK